MKRKLRELVIAVVLIVMSAALCITLISCGSDNATEDKIVKTEVSVNADESKAAAEENGDDSKSSDRSESSKTDLSKSDNKKETTKAAEAAAEPTTKAPEVCYISIEGYCSGKSVTLQGGDTVYSILCRSGASVSGSGHYVKGINGKFEFDEGPTSGWTYYVNGSKPGVGCGSYSVKAGDNIKWDYVTSY